MRAQRTTPMRCGAWRALPLACVAFAAAPVQDLPQGEPLDLRFAVEPGTQLVKSWFAEHTLLMDRMTMKLGDLEPSVIDLRSVIQSQFEFDWVDRYDAFDAERVTSLRRAYDKGRLVGALKIQDLDKPPKVADMTSPLQGKSVVFTWVPSEQSYGRYYDALEGDEEDLPPLGVETDLRSLLPARPVRVGETWTVDAQALRDVVAPGGTLHFKPGKTFDRLLGRALTAGVGGGLEQAFGGESEGGVTLTLTGVEQREGRRMAVIALVVKAKYGKDQTDFSRENMARREEERGAEFVSNHLVLRLDGDGVLLWDVAAGHAAQLELDLAEEVTMRIVEKHRKSGTRFEQDMSMRGRLKSRLVVDQRD